MRRRRRRGFRRRAHRAVQDLVEHGSLRGVRVLGRCGQLDVGVVDRFSLLLHLLPELLGELLLLLGLHRADDASCLRPRGAVTEFRLQPSLP